MSSPRSIPPPPTPRPEFASGTTELLLRPPNPIAGLYRFALLHREEDLVWMIEETQRTNAAEVVELIQRHVGHVRRPRHPLLAWAGERSVPARVLTTTDVHRDTPTTAEALPHEHVHLAGEVVVDHVHHHPLETERLDALLPRLRRVYRDAWREMVETVAGDVPPFPLRTLVPYDDCPPSGPVARRVVIAEDDDYLLTV